MTSPYDVTLVLVVLMDTDQLFTTRPDPTPDAGPSSTRPLGQPDL